MKLLALTLALALAPAAPALAQDPEPPPEETIAVEIEPPGENCETGGIKVTVTPVEEPPPDEGEEPAPAEPRIYYVCNGQPGPPGDPGDPGAPGEPGEPGADGQDGQDGADGMDGNDGADGMDGEPGEPGTIGSPTSTRSCGHRTARLRLPRRFGGGRRVRVILNGDRRMVRPNTRRVIKVPLRGLRCGSYPILVQRRGARTLVQVWTLLPGEIVRTAIVR